MKSEHIAAVVAIHLAVLRTTLNARMGAAHLQRLYQTVLGSPSVRAWVAIDATGTVVGFITTCHDLHAVERQIRDAISFRQYLRAGAFLCLHPKEVRHLMARRRFTAYLKESYPAILPTILTLGVSPLVQKTGLGGQLVGRAVQEFTTDAVPELYVDTEASNTGAVRFYQRMGFRQLAVVEGNVFFAHALSS